jgi:hypothetical protein
VSETSLGQGWWFSSTGRWYSPEQVPDATLFTPKVQTSRDVMPTRADTREAVLESPVWDGSVAQGVPATSSGTDPDGRSKRFWSRVVLGASSTDTRRTWT